MGHNRHLDLGANKFLPAIAAIRSQNDGNLNPNPNPNPTDVHPYQSLEFASAREAYNYYCSYADRTGFIVGIRNEFPSEKNEGLITYREFVCSRDGCGAFMRIQRQESGIWIVPCWNKDHNHNPQSPAAVDDTIDRRRMNIGNDFYPILLAYFQSRLAVDTGFFYALEVNQGKCGSVFWADGRSRFSCSQFGEAIVFDTSYRSNNAFPAPFAFFVGVNHHKQPVLLGSALIASESEECFTWVFQTWITAMSGQRPLSIIADQDSPIQRSIARVFPDTHHRFSASQIKANERQLLGLVLPKDRDEFKLDYKICVSLSRTTPTEFDSAWNLLLSKYRLEENLWLKELYQNRRSWVPLYIKGTFFAGIPMDDDGNAKSFFGNFLNGQSPLEEFVKRYERAVKHRREEEKTEDFNTFNCLPIKLRTQDPIEEQGRLHYTMTVFKVFQKELLESYFCLGIKIGEEAANNQYLVQNFGKGNNSDEKNTVAINTSNLNTSCSCKMFEFEGVLCRHILKVFEILKIRDLPSRYILHRWTKNARFGALREDVSMGGYGDGRVLMLWSLREAVSNYVQVGASSHERFKFALDILLEGRKSLFYQKTASN